ncbi:MAG: hypothetical protein EZS28_015050 [Streblomastix strix]|uniref:Uncharacterized protein n=1 Tax=Streblomastix strix TaxID=222440 RepID=A0A5J4W3D1_9EUKA|nr:MAG: hypothetical protein EZS28_015050 [Streblomastix strix]
MFRGGSITVNGLNINDKEHDGAPNKQEQDPPRGGGNEEDQAVPIWMRVLIGRPSDSPEAARELLLQREDETLRLELNKKGETPGSEEADLENEIETARMAFLIQRA